MILWLVSAREFNIYSYYCIGNLLVFSAFCVNYVG